MDVIVDNLPRVLEGFWMTIQISAISLGIGFVLSIPISLCRRSRNKLIYSVSTAYVFFFRGTPLLAQLFLVYYGLGQFHENLQAVGLWHFLRDPWFCGILTLTLNTIAYSSEIWRGGLDGVPKGEIEAARAFGLSRWAVFRCVVFPRALGICWPAYTNEVVYQIQATSLVSAISVMDLTGVARSIANQSFAYYESFLTAAVLYLALVYGFIVLAKLLEKRIHVFRAA